MPETVRIVGSIRSLAKDLLKAIWTVKDGFLFGKMIHAEFSLLNPHSLI